MFIVKVTKGHPAFFARASSVLSSCHPCSRTAVPPGCICPLLSPWGFQPCYPSWTVFFVSYRLRQLLPAISVSVLMLHPFVGSHYALWKRIDTFSRDLLAFKLLTLHGVINKSLSSIVCGPDCQVLCFGAMSLLFFLCKFSASDIWQVPLCCMEFRVIISSDNLRQPSAFSS